MTELVLERQFDEALTRQSVIGMAQEGAWCMELYRVDWLGSLLSADGHTMVCRFRARDAEAIRQALATLHTDMRVLWEGTTHEVDDPGEANVVVERSFSGPVALDELQAKEDASQWCLDSYKVSFVRTHFAIDRKRMLCLYRGPDAESVKAAQLQAQMPLDRVWSFEEIRMANAAG